MIDAVKIRKRLLGNLREMYTTLDANMSLSKNTVTIWSTLESLVQNLLSLDDASNAEIRNCFTVADGWLHDDLKPLADQSKLALVRKINHQRAQLHACLQIGKDIYDQASTLFEGCMHQLEIAQGHITLAETFQVTPETPASLAMLFEAAEDTFRLLRIDYLTRSQLVENLNQAWNFIKYSGRYAPLERVAHVLQSGMQSWELLSKDDEEQMIHGNVSSTNMCRTNLVVCVNEWRSKLATAPSLNSAYRCAFNSHLSG